VNRPWLDGSADLGGSIRSPGRFPSEPLPGWSGFPCPQNYRPQNHGAVSAGCDQIERKAMPKICRVFNEFCPGSAYLIIDVERAGGPKLARLRRRSIHPALALRSSTRMLGKHDFYILSTLNQIEGVGANPAAKGRCG
jgi:hypothetical protein